MHLYKVLKIITVAALISGCGNSSKPIKHFLIQTNANKNVISNTDTLKLSLSNPSNKKIDSVNYVMNNSAVADIFSLQNSSLGEKMIKAEVFYGGKKEVALQKVIVVNGSTPKLYNYELLNTYPHDITSYTQGLEFYKGVLYESTGQYGESKLRALDYKNDAILNNVNLSRSYFGEGLTIINNKIIQLTWKSKIGFVYDKTSMDLKNSFEYKESTEGWGLCNDGEFLYKSDGTNKIWKLDPTSYQELSYIEVYTNKSKLNKLNELEWVKGCLLYTSPSPRDKRQSRMPSSA